MPDTPAPSDDPRAGSVDPKLYPASPFPAADWSWFLDRCQALGIEDPAPFRPAIEALYAHLVGVNAWLNLTRIAGVRDYLKWHVLDSLTAGSTTLIIRTLTGKSFVDSAVQNKQLSVGGTVDLAAIEKLAQGKIDKNTQR